MNALDAWALIVVGAVVGAVVLVAVLRLSYLLWGRGGVGFGAVSLAILVAMSPLPDAAVRVLNVGLGGPHPCDNGRTCVPAAGISLVLAPGWAQLAPGQSEGLFSASAGGVHRRVWIILEDARVYLDPPPTDIDLVGPAAQQVRNDENVWLGYRNDNPDAEVERVELPIGSAVRVRWVAPHFLVGNYAHIDYWFFAHGRLLVMTYEEPQESVPGFLPMGIPTSVDAIVQSIQLIE